MNEDVNLVLILFTFNYKVEAVSSIVKASVVFQENDSKKILKGNNIPSESQKQTSPMMSGTCNSSSHREQKTHTINVSRSRYVYV